MVSPKIASTAFIAPGAILIGNVTIGERCAVLFNTTVRADFGEMSMD